MALDVRTETRRTQVSTSTDRSRSTSNTNSTTSTKKDTAKPATSTTSTTPSTTSSGASTDPRSRPTLRTSLDSRERFRSESGTAQRAFALNRRVDLTVRPIGQPAGTTQPTGQVADGQSVAPTSTETSPASTRTTRGRALALADDTALSNPKTKMLNQVDPGGGGGGAGGATDDPDEMTGEEAIAVLDRDFDQFDTANQGGSTDGRVSQDDLRAVADNKGNGFTDEQQQAAQFLIDSKAYNSFVDVGAGRGSVDGTISREDVDGAQATIATGSHYDELLDTANGRGGRDGHVGSEDVTAALSDPGISQETKDTINLMLQSSDGSENLHGALSQLSTSEVQAASELARSPEYAALSGSDKQLVGDAFRDGGGDTKVTSELSGLLESADFQNGTAAEKTSELNRVALLNSTEFNALPEADQNRIRDAIAAADPTDLAMPESIRNLIQNPNFNDDLSAEEKTAILSQIGNYPESRVVDNLELMVNKDWFQDQSTADMQRSAKLVAYLSQDESGDRTIVENTLNRFLSPDSDFRLRWEGIDPEGGNLTLGYADGDTLTLNSNLVRADNNPAQPDELGIIENTTAHEVSHLVNGDNYNQTFEYLNEEYRAWYVGYEAEHGRPPSNQEAMDRWEYFLNPNGGYAEAAYGTESWLPFGWGDNPGAMEKPEEAEKIYDLLSNLSGLEVTADNYQDVMADPSKWTTNPNGPASDDVFPDSDDLDN